MKKAEILKFAKLARIKISDQEAEQYTSEFLDIMKMLDQINEVKISDEVVRDFRLKNIMREDEIDFDQDIRDRVVNEFPEKNDDEYLKVQKILNNN